MKKIICTVLALICVFCVASCSEDAFSYEKESSVMPTIINTSEYTLYTNIFYNDYGSRFENQKVTKTGTFTTLYDRYTGKTRYYVWGYNDNTKCCDWQWEFVAPDENNLPDNGSLVTLTGNFVKDSNALDGYWITDATLTVITKYTPKSTYDIDMCTMDSTLERVQIVNIQNKSDYFDGKSVSAYGRINSDNSIQHPYYDGDFELSFTTSGKVPSIGTYVIVTGTLKNGVIENAAVEETDLY